MILQVFSHDQRYGVEVTEALVQEADGFFAKMDADMEKGWQMSRQWVERPDRIQRCQIAADRLLAAVESGDQPTAMMMAGYILSRMPGVNQVRVDTSGEMQETEFSTWSRSGIF